MTKKQCVIYRLQYLEQYKVKIDRVEVVLKKKKCAKKCSDYNFYNDNPLVNYFWTFQYCYNQ